MCPNTSDVPSIQLNEKVFIEGLENPHKMNENSSPYSRLKLVHYIWQKDQEQIET
jgi:hypothetical protein